MPKLFTVGRLLSSEVMVSTVHSVAVVRFGGDMVWVWCWVSYSCCMLTCCVQCEWKYSVCGCFGFTVQCYTI